MTALITCYVTSPLALCTEIVDILFDDILHAHQFLLSCYVDFDLVTVIIIVVGVVLLPVTLLLLVAVCHEGGKRCSRKRDVNGMHLYQFTFTPPFGKCIGIYPYSHYYAAIDSAESVAAKENQLQWWFNAESNVLIFQSPSLFADHSIFWQACTTCTILWFGNIYVRTTFMHPIKS